MSKIQIASVICWFAIIIVSSALSLYSALGSGALGMVITSELPPGFEPGPLTDNMAKETGHDSLRYQSSELVQANFLPFGRRLMAVTSLVNDEVNCPTCGLKPDEPTRINVALLRELEEVEFEVCFYVLVKISDFAIQNSGCFFG